MTQEQMQEDLSEFLTHMVEASVRFCPSWLSANSYFMSIVPGHNLDLFQMSFDFRIDRTTILYTDTPDILKDPSKANLGVVK